VLPNSGTTTYELSLPSGKGGLAFVYSLNILSVRHICGLHPPGL
jgi:hypothetical protein